MSTKRRIARVSVRIVIGVVAVAVAGATIAAATTLTLPNVQATPGAVRVSPVPTAGQRVCPGPLLELAGDSTAATDASSFGAPSIVSGTGDSGQIGTATIATGGAAGSNGSPNILTVPVPPGTHTPPLVAASQTQLADLEDLHGLAAASCDDASSDTWLVGGATNLGQTSLVLLANPSTVQATVDLTVYGESGPIDAPGATGIAVPPKTQKIVPLAGLAPSIAAPVVHVQTRGGRVLASMQQSFVRGLDPDGVELEGTTNGPTTHQVITGVAVRTIAALKAAQSGEAYGVDLPAVRVLLPGKTAAQVTVGIVGEVGTAAGNSVSATVQPGVATEIPLDHLVDGDYTVTVDSTQPVVAAARTSTTSATGTDFGWFVASRALNGSFLAAVGDGPGAQLHLANTTTAQASLTVTSHSGVAKKVTIPAKSAANVAVQAGVYTVTGGTGVLASVSYAGSGVISAFALEPSLPLAEPITVYPH